jgi:transcriptional regulator with XRE-family HTH domain
MAMKIGEKIKILRKAKNISQESLARVLGVTFQAVSKWETNTTAPDVALIPSIASYFGVTIDELFDYKAFENEKKIDDICRNAANCRLDAPIRAETILREGLRQFPSNETMLTVLVYVLWAIPGRQRELIDTCKQLVECTTNEGVRCDALRILAEAYHRAGELDQIMPILNQIPEFYFSKLECIARLSDGKTSLDAAHFQMNISGKCLIEMLNIMAKQFAAIGENTKSEQCMRIADKVLNAFRDEGGRGLEIAGYEWLD